MSPGGYAPSFAGEIVVGEEALPEAALVLVDAHLSAPALDAGLFAGDALVVLSERRPDRGFVADALAAASAGGAAQVAAIGSGALLDAAKLVSLALEEQRGLPVPLTFVPCGPEPYRAFARFAVVDQDGQRPTVVDPRFARARVLLATRLLAAQAEEIVAVHALDTAVHCVESLLSSHAHPAARLLALAALRTVAEEVPRFRGEPETAGARLVVAAAAAVEAFSTTRLGLAHAIASPLGTRLGVTHDTINGVLGEAVVTFWGEEVPGFADVAAGLGVEPSLGAVVDALAWLRARATLPASLEAMGVAWSDVESVLPQAARSSGIAALPGPVDAASIESFAARAWAGGVSQEEVGNRGAT